MLCNIREQPYLGSQGFCPVLKITQMYYLYSLFVSFPNSKVEHFFTLPFLCCSHHASWCPGNGISRHGIYHISRKIPSEVLLSIVSLALPTWRLLNCPQTYTDIKGPLYRTNYVGPIDIITEHTKTEPYLSFWYTVSVICTAHWFASDNT